MCKWHYTAARGSLLSMQWIKFGLILVIAVAKNFEGLQKIFVWKFLRVRTDASFISKNIPFLINKNSQKIIKIYELFKKKILIFALKSVIFSKMLQTGFTPEISNSKINFHIRNKSPETLILLSFLPSSYIFNLNFE